VKKGGIESDLRMGMGPNRRAKISPLHSRDEGKKDASTVTRIIVPQMPGKKRKPAIRRLFKRRGKKKGGDPYAMASSRVLKRRGCCRSGLLIS